MAFQIGDKYYHEDYESGEIVEISEETYNSMMAFRKRIESMVKSNMGTKGHIHIFSTPCDPPDNTDYRNLWDDFKKQ